MKKKPEPFEPISKPAPNLVLDDCPIDKLKKIPVLYHNKNTEEYRDKGLKSTGSADFQKIWTYLGLPAISLPLLSGENDLPLGVQLVGDRFDDLRFLGTANWLEKNCKDE